MWLAGTKNLTFKHGVRAHMELLKVLWQNWKG